LSNNQGLWFFRLRRKDLAENGVSWKSDESLLLNPFFKCYAFFYEEEEIPRLRGSPPKQVAESIEDKGQ